jgi:hypothetical protein
VARSTPTHPEGVPVVSTIDRAAAMLGLEPGRLAQAVAQAGVPVWGHHATGVVVHRWVELLDVARELGAKVPKPLAPGPRLITFSQHRGAEPPPPEATMNVVQGHRASREVTRARTATARSLSSRPRGPRFRRGLAAGRPWPPTTSRR